MKSSGKYERWEEGECTLHRDLNMAKQAMLFDSPQHGF